MNNEISTFEETPEASLDATEVKAVSFTDESGCLHKGGILLGVDNENEENESRKVAIILYHGRKVRTDMSKVNLLDTESMDISDGGVVISNFQKHRESFSKFHLQSILPHCAHESGTKTRKTRKAR